MKCDVCGEEIADGSNFCSNCETKIKNFKCPKCDLDITGNESFCPSCGYYLNSDYSAAIKSFSKGVNELKSGLTGSYKNFKNRDDVTNLSNKLKETNDNLGKKYQNHNQNNNLNDKNTVNEQYGDKISYDDENQDKTNNISSEDSKGSNNETINNVSDKISQIGSGIVHRVTEDDDEKKEREMKKKPEGALYFIDGREATIAVFSEYIEFDFTEGVIKKYLSYLGGVKRVYYHQINSIQKRDANNFILGSIEFEMPGIVKSRNIWDNDENVIHYATYYQDEVNDMYEYVNDKILKIHNPNPVNKVHNSNQYSEKSPLEKIKEAKELLDMGAITQEEFNKIKENNLKDI